MFIEYRESNGRIEVVYMLENEEDERFPEPYLMIDDNESWGGWLSAGLVPKRIRKKGARAIEDWTQKTCAKDLEKRIKKAQDEFEAQEKRMNSTERLLRVKCMGILLIGHVDYDNRYCGQVHLDQPFKGELEESLYYHYRAPGSATPIFKEDGQLNKEGLDLAERQLIEIYETAIRQSKHGKTLNLVEELNEASEEQAKKKYSRY